MGALKAYADSALTTELTEIPTLSRTDGVGDPIDYDFYIGSVAVSEKYEAASDPGVDQLVLAIQYRAPTWTATTAQTAEDLPATEGSRVRPTVANGFSYKCIAASGAGETGASEPTWPTTPGATVVDGDVTWECETALHLPTEIKLAATSGGLGSAVAGASLNLGTEILSGAGNAFHVYMRVDNATTAEATKRDLKLAIAEWLPSPA